MTISSPVRVLTSLIFSNKILPVLSVCLLGGGANASEVKTDVRGYYLGMPFSKVIELSNSNSYYCTNPGPRHIRCDLRPGKEIPEFIDLAIASDNAKSVYQIDYEPTGKVDLRNFEETYQLKLVSKNGTDAEFKSIYTSSNGMNVRVEHIEFKFGNDYINSYKFQFENTNLTKSLNQTPPVIVPNAKF